MAKIIVSIEHAGSREKIAALVKLTADALGVREEDICVVPSGVTVYVLEVPAELTRAREEADVAAEKEAKEAEAAKVKAGAEAAKAEPAPKKAEAAPAGNGYESWTIEKLHEEATAREIPGRGTMNKAALIAAIQKLDKKEG